MVVAGTVPIIRCPRGNAADMVAEVQRLITICSSLSCKLQIYVFSFIIPYLLVCLITLLINCLPLLMAFFNILFVKKFMYLFIYLQIHQWQVYKQ